MAQALDGMNTTYNNRKFLGKSDMITINCKLTSYIQVFHPIIFSICLNIRCFHSKYL
jgi:hypothetical protein